MNSCQAIWFFIGYSPGTNNYSVCNECKPNCAVAHRMTIFKITNASDAGGKHFNLSKNDCSQCCSKGSYNLIMSLEGDNAVTWKPQTALNGSDKNLISDETSHSQSHNDDVCSSVTWRNLQRCLVSWTTFFPPEAPRLVFLSFNPTSWYRGSSLSEIILVWIGQWSHFWEVLRDKTGREKHWSDKMQFYDFSCHIYLLCQFSANTALGPRHGDALRRCTEPGCLDRRRMQECASHRLQCTISSEGQARGNTYSVCF